MFLPAGHDAAAIDDESEENKDDKGAAAEDANQQGQSLAGDTPQEAPGRARGAARSVGAAVHRPHARGQRDRLLEDARVHQLGTAAVTSVADIVKIPSRSW